MADSRSPQVRSALHSPPQRHPNGHLDILASTIPSHTTRGSVHLPCFHKHLERCRRSVVVCYLEPNNLHERRNMSVYHLYPQVKLSIPHRPIKTINNPHKNYSIHNQLVVTIGMPQGVWSRHPILPLLNCLSYPQGYSYRINSSN